MKVVKTTNWSLNLEHYGKAISDKSFCVNSDAESIIIAYLKDRQVDFVLNNHLFILISPNVSIIGKNTICSVSYRNEYYIEED